MRLRYTQSEQWDREGLEQEGDKRKETKEPGLGPLLAEIERRKDGEEMKNEEWNLEKKIGGIRKEAWDDFNTRGNVIDPIYRLIAACNLYAGV